MRCKLCHSKNTAPIPFQLPIAVGRWSRCGSCESDTNALHYNSDLYHSGLAVWHRDKIGGGQTARSQVQSNCDWFDHHHVLDSKDFLDVGCADGACLDVMQERGWAIHGFDVAVPDYHGPHVTVSPFFHRWLFPRRYAAIMAREVFEHVPNPDMFLHELHGAAEPNGLVQIQVPRPIGAADHNIYQTGHLFLPSVDQFKRMLGSAMLDIVDFREWPMGMAALCRARP